MELSACIVVYNGCDEALKAAQTVLQYTRRHPLTIWWITPAPTAAAHVWKPP